MYLFLLSLQYQMLFFGESNSFSHTGVLVKTLSHKFPDSLLLECMRSKNLKVPMTRFQLSQLFNRPSILASRVQCHFTSHPD